MSEIVLNHVSKHYGSVHHAVKDINLAISDREFISLVGPSGCGKSTTLRMIAGLESISAGEIKIGSRVVNDLAPKDRDIAMVFQNYALYQHMSVYDNLAFGLRNKKVSEPEIKKSIDYATGMLGLGDLLARKPRQLSGGQQQRVALGRCLVRNPRAFLFDEPLSNLDAKLRTQMRLEIKRLRTQVPTTSIFVTHDQVEAMTLGDRIVVMKDGAIQQVGTPLEVYRHPVNTFVAGFIGAPAMNFFDLALRTQGETILAEGPGCHFEVPSSALPALSSWQDKTIRVGVRPENITLATSDRYSLDANVEVIEQLGSELVIEAKCSVGHITIARIDPGAILNVGERIYLSVSPEALHFFDLQTGLRLA
jgi:multiple sugar transport system ATP-binding protein